MFGLTPTTEANTNSEAGNTFSDDPFYNVMPKAKMGAGTNSNEKVPATVSSQTVPGIQVSTVTETANKEGTDSPPNEKPQNVLKTEPTPIKKYTPPSKGAFSNIINPENITKQNRFKNLTQTVLKAVIGLIAIALVGLAVWYTANSFGGTLGLPKLGNWIKQLPFINKTQPNTADSAGGANQGESKALKLAEDSVAGDEKLTTPEWRLKYFDQTSCGTGTACFDGTDVDVDGLNNNEEFKQGTDPKNPDSDGDGIADGDEVKIFSCSPLDPRTGGSLDYTDADDIRGGWKCSRKNSEDEYYTQEDLLRISSNAKIVGFHEPTPTTLGADAQWYIDWGSVSAKPEVQGISLPEGFDQSEEAKLDRDIQRLSTMKKVGIALIKFKQEIGYFPETNNFAVMSASIKPYNSIATNTFDPINVSPYEYSYELDVSGDSFKLVYYSETQRQPIKYNSTQAQKDYFAELATDRDEQRMYDLDKLRSALLIVSAAEAEAGDTFLFPSRDSFESKITPQYLPKLPVDPITDKNYEYEVSKDRTSFTLKAVLENPPTGNTGYMCNQEECRVY